MKLKHSVSLSQLPSLLMARHRSRGDRYNWKIASCIWSANKQHHVRLHASLWVNACSGERHICCTGSMGAVCRTGPSGASLPRDAPSNNRHAIATM